MTSEQREHNVRAVRALRTRADAFVRKVERELALSGDRSPGTTHALELFLGYVDALFASIERDETTLSDALFATSIRAYNDHFRKRVDLFDNRFGRSSGNIPPALPSAVERECRAWGLDVEAVITVGEPGNFTTFIADLASTLVNDLPVLPPATVSRQLVSIAVPELEGLTAAWQPVTIGHELAHYLQLRKSVAAEGMVIAKLDNGKLNVLSDRLPPQVTMAPTRRRGFEQVAVRWLNEIICDAYAVHRFGPAGVVAMAEFLDHVGPSGPISATHPPTVLRRWLMNSWLAPARGWQVDVIGPFDQPADPAPPGAPDWVIYLTNIFVDLAVPIWTAVSTWAPTARYQSGSRGEVVLRAADELDAGIPCASIAASGEATAIGSADVINACWLALARGSARPVDRLALKALDTLDFIDLWVEAGGELENDDGDSTPSTGPGVLTAPDLTRRLDAAGPDRLVITPRIGRPGGASLDVRLGNGFIVFERTSSAAFDSLSHTQRPSSMQQFVQKSWGDVFYLHPGQLVLAATLEYISLPRDLTAQVITRSSYGRLGLLSATAVQVHPDYFGCLTLELVNLGEMPLTLTPGERVAQLVLSTASEPVAPDAEAKYRYPTQPEFSKIMDDAESGVIRDIRDAWRGRRHR